MAKNCYSVQKKVWNGWSKSAQAVFNRSYRYFINNKEVMIHPKSVPPTKEQWRTTAWNAAWVSANMVDNITMELQ